MTPNLMLRSNLLKTIFARVKRGSEEENGGGESPTTRRSSGENKTLGEFPFASTPHQFVSFL